MNAVRGNRVTHFSVRLPHSLNTYLVRRAKLEVRSKNQLLITMIMEAQKNDMVDLTAEAYRKLNEEIKED